MKTGFGLCAIYEDCILTLQTVKPVFDYVAFGTSLIMFCPQPLKPVCTRTKERKKEKKKKKEEERKKEEEESTVHSLSRSNFLTTGRSSIFSFKLPFYLRSLKVMGKLIHSFNVQSDHETITGRHLSHLQCPIFSASKVIYMAAQSIKSAQHHHKCMYNHGHTSLVKFCYTKTIVITT